jgi:hypothetical protein
VTNDPKGGRGSQNVPILTAPAQQLLLNRLARLVGGEQAAWNLIRTALRRMPTPQFPSRVGELVAFVRDDLSRELVPLTSKDAVDALIAELEAEGESQISKRTMPRPRGGFEAKPVVAVVDRDALRRGPLVRALLHAGYTVEVIVEPEDLKTILGLIDAVVIELDVAPPALLSMFQGRRVAPAVVARTRTAPPAALEGLKRIGIGRAEILGVTASSADIVAAASDEGRVNGE